MKFALMILLTLLALSGCKKPACDSVTYYFKGNAITVTDPECKA